MFLKFIKRLDSTQKSALMNVALKPINMVLSLIYTPMLIRYLGIEKYGLWATLLSIISWINYCDIGIGQGLRNLLVKELTLERYEDARKSISTAYVVLSIISFLLWVISLLCILKLDWGSIFSTDIDMIYPLGISFTFICINFVLALSNTILFALQLSEMVAVRNCAVQLFNIVGVYVLSLYTHGSLILLSILFGFSSTVIFFISTFKIFKKYKFLRCSYHLFEKTKIKTISNTGMQFFFIQAFLIVFFAMDNLLVTNMFGSIETTSYDIANKAFGALFAVITALVVPYWSKTTQAVASKNFQWIRKTFRQLNIVAIIFLVFYVLLAFSFEWITGVWLGKHLNYPKGLILAMFCYYSFLTVSMVSVYMINGTGELKCQVFMNFLEGISYIPLSIFLAKTCGFGVVGIKWAGVIFRFICMIVYPINLNYIINKLEAINKNEESKYD